MRSMYFIGVSLTVIILAATSAMVRHRSTQRPAAAAPASSASALAELEQLIAEHSDRYRQANARAYAQFEAAVEAELVAAFDPVLANIPAAVTELTSWRTTAAMAQAYCSDKLKGANTTGQIIDSTLEPAILTPCRRAVDQTQHRLDALQQQLAENRTTLHAELAATMVEPQFATLLDDDATQNLHLTINDLEARLNAAALASAITAVGAGIDAVFIKSSLAGLTRVATAATTKMATSATIGTGCAAADGPLPVGDIIGAIAFAGGAAWTAWDLYQARIALPKEITREVTASMTASRDEVIRATREEGRRLFELHENGGRDIVAQLERQMQGGQP